MLRGHERAAAFLRRAASGDQLAHSLLIAGADGIGKRSLAVAFATWIQCESRGEGRAQSTRSSGDSVDAVDDACGECGGCRQVAAGSHPDVKIIGIPAGKKEIGVDHARDLKRWVSLRATGGGRKVAIVLDAQMLTIAAQNALLKTLEEPPSHASILLVTDNADALLPTIRSRCQRVPIRPLATELVAELLRERHGIDAARADELARHAEGSPGRALALCTVMEDGKTIALLHELAGLPGARYVRLAQMAAALNQPESDTVAKLEGLLRSYRDSLLIAPTDASSKQRLLRNAEAVSSALSAMRRTNPNRQLLLEALLLQIAPQLETTP